MLRYRAHKCYAHKSLEPKSYLDILIEPKRCLICLSLGVPVLKKMVCSIHDEQRQTLKFFLIMSYFRIEFAEEIATLTRPLSGHPKLVSC